MTGRVRFQHLTAEPAKFRRIVNGGIWQFVFWDNVCPNSTNECGGFAMLPQLRQIDRWLKLHVHVERLGLEPMLPPDEAAKVRRRRIGKREQQRLGHHASPLANVTVILVRRGSVCQRNELEANAINDPYGPARAVYVAIRALMSTP